MPDTIDEIIIREVRPDGVTYPWWWFGGKGADPDEDDLSNYGGDEFGGGSDSPPPATDDGEDAFAPPPVLPVPIQEIVVTAQRTQVVRPPFLSTGGSAGILAFAGVLSAFIDQLGENLLQSAGFQATREVFQKTKDTPVVPLPEVLPEIVVTARRGDFRALFPQVAPMPLLPGDYDPFVLIPINPVRLPQPQVDLPGRVDIETPTAPRIAPVTFPVPLPNPLGIPFPSPFPLPLPNISPEPFPQPSPQPFATPVPTPTPTPVPVPTPTPVPVPTPTGFPNPLTGVDPFALGLPQPQPELAGCPPCPKPKKCKKEEDKPRDQCFRKLVKEGRLPSMDISYEWAEIDCETGKEI